MFWLSQPVAEAIRRTQAPGSFNWYRMPLPFEAAVFMLPKGTLTHPDDGDIIFLSYARMMQGGEHKSTLIPGTTFGSVNGSMVFVALTQAGYLLHWNLPLDAFGESISMPDIDDLVLRYAHETHSSATDPFQNNKMTPADNQTIALCAHYVFGTLLAMEARPELITHGKMLKRVNKGGHHNEFWSPNIIGRDYVLKNEAGQGTHASPRMHWVRGFYRDQAIGPGRAQHKRIWVEPFMRGA
jgi:hypothetical protein